MKDNQNLALVKIFLQLSFISLLPPLILIFPFWRGWEQFYYLKLGSNGIFQILSNWDGPHYMLIAKTFYDENLIGPRLFMALPIEYFYNHFPLYPLLIKLTSFLTSFLWSGIIVNLIFGLLSNIYFYAFIKNHSKNPLWLTFLFTIFPARFWIVRSIVAPETLMLFGILASIYYFEKKSYFAAILFSCIATATKFQAIILPIAYLLAFMEFPLLEILCKLNTNGKHFLQSYRQKSRYYYNKSTICQILGISGILVVFSYYYFLSGNFFIYFASQKMNHLTAGLPFAMFDIHSPWASTPWLEDIVLYFVILMIMIAKLFTHPNRNYFWFVTSYTAMLILIPQRDITRLSIPLLPFFYLLFAQFFQQKTVKIAMIIAITPLYLYSMNFILGNYAPIADWSLILR